MARLAVMAWLPNQSWLGRLSGFNSVAWLGTSPVCASATAAGPGGDQVKSGERTDWARVATLGLPSEPVLRFSIR